MWLGQILRALQIINQAYQLFLPLRKQINLNRTKSRWYPSLNLGPIFLTHLRLQNYNFLYFRTWLINALWNGDKIVCGGKCTIFLRSLLYSNLSGILSLLILSAQRAQHGNEEESPGVGWEKNGLARGLLSAMKSSQDSGVNWPDRYTWGGRTRGFAGSEACPWGLDSRFQREESGHLQKSIFSRTPV